MNNPCSPLLAGVLELFELFFSEQLLKQFFQEEASPKAAPPLPAQPRSKAQRKKNPTRFYERIFSLRVTLWYLVFQRVNTDRTLEAVVRDARRGGADGLVKARGKKPSKRIRSRQSTSFNDARQRLPERLVRRAFEHGRQVLMRLAGLDPQAEQPPPPEQRSLQALDGSTLGMRSNEAKAKEYPPASNQHGKSYWLLMRIVCGFCTRTGAVLNVVQGALTRSEQQLAWALMGCASAFTVWIGDRNFGVFSVVERARHFRQDVLVRLMERRVDKSLRKGSWTSGQEQQICWKPSRKDQLADGADPTGVEGRLIYILLEQPGFRTEKLWLFTTLLDAQLYPVQLLLKWYGLRWQAELNFRYLKTQLNMHTLEVATPEMARKEFYAGLLAYNLIRAVMYAAGERLGQGPGRLSFSQARRALFCSWLSLQSHRQQLHWVEALVEEVGGGLLPKRKKKRESEPRKKRHRYSAFPQLIGTRAEARAKLRNECKS